MRHQLQTTDKQLGPREAGSMGGAAIIAVGVIALAGFYITNITQSSRNDIKAAKKVAESESAANGGLSSFSVFRSLLKNMKTDNSAAAAGGFTYSPFLYASNYFDEKWTFKQNPYFTDTSTATPSGAQKVILSTTRRADLTLEGAKPVVTGVKKQTDKTDGTNLTTTDLEIVSYKRDNARPFWVKSIVVKASDRISVGTQTKNAPPSFAEIQLPAPTPSLVRVFAMREGDPTPLYTFGTPTAPLPAGRYSFGLEAAGVVWYGYVQLNTEKYKVGALAGNDKPVHSATNILHPATIIGQTEYKQLGTTVTVTTAPTTSTGGTFQGQKIIRAADGCGFEVLENQTVTYGGGGSGTASVTTSVPGPNTIEVRGWVVKVDGSTTEEEFPIAAMVYIKDGSEVASGAPVAVATAGAPEGTGNNCAQACSKQSVSILNPAVTSNEQFFDWMDRSRLGNPADTDVIDVQSTFELQKDAGGHRAKGKVCLSREDMAKDIFRRWGVSPTVASRSGNRYFDEFNRVYVSEIEPLEKYVYYLEPACERMPVGLRGGCGCFAADTQIQMADGSLKTVALIREGDFVWNPKTKRSQRIKEVVAGPEKPALIEVQTATRSLTITKAHPFLTDKGIVMAKMLKAGDILIDGDARSIIKSVKNVVNYRGEKEPEVWNFVLEGSESPDDHYVNANGLMSGDLFLQRQLSESQRSLALGPNVL